MKLQIGDTIKSLRKRDGKTQENLADALGITFQSVSRWESGAAYPDMELVPVIANYFGVSIDELFGYQNERAVKVEELVEKINEMNKANNGEDCCIDQCVQLAREGLIEFPGNEKLLFCLASLLYNAGYARYGEHHLTDENGYDVFDVTRHKRYAEWGEAIPIYEKLFKMLDDGEQKYEAVCRLAQLYVMTGETEKAMALVEIAPDISVSKDLLMLSACDGKRRAEEYDRALSKLLCTSANLMTSTVMVNKRHISNEMAIDRIRNAVELFRMDYTGCPQTFYELAGLHLYLSEFLWRAGDRDGAFAALEQALAASKMHDTLAKEEMTAGLPEYWPFWGVPDPAAVRKEMQADARWAAWVDACRAQKV